MSNIKNSPKPTNMEHSTTKPKVKKPKKILIEHDFGDDESDIEDLLYADYVSDEEIPVYDPEVVSESDDDDEVSHKEEDCEYLHVAVEDPNEDSDSDDEEDIFCDGDESDDEDDEDDEEDEEEDEKEEKEEEEEEEEKNDVCVDSKPSNIVAKEDRITFPYLTKYEKISILGARTQQIMGGAPVMIDIYDLPGNTITPYAIALEELMQKKSPFIIKRPMPNGKIEIWEIKELIIF